MEKLIFIVHTDTPSRIKFFHTPFSKTLRNVDGWVDASRYDALP